MKISVFKKILSRSIFFIALLAFLLGFSLTAFGQDGCPLPLGVEVSPYQVNIDADGAAHYVRVLTYTAYSNTAQAFVYINDNDIPVDPESIQITRDSIGHLVIKIDLDALQDAGLEPVTNHYLKIAVVLKTSVDGCFEKVGLGEILIIGKKGA